MRGRGQRREFPTWHDVCREVQENVPRSSSRKKNQTGIYILSFSFVLYFVNAEERNRKAHAENGNTSVSFPAAPVQPPAPCVPQMRRLAPCSGPRSASCFFFPEVEGHRRRSCLLRRALLGACRGPRSSRQGFSAPADFAQAPHRHHEAGFHCSMHVRIITLITGLLTEML